MNFWDILFTVIIFGVVIMVVTKLIIDKKNGKTSCTNCENYGKCFGCNKNKKDKK